MCLLLRFVSTQIFNLSINKIFLIIKKAFREIGFNPIIEFNPVFRNDFKLLKKNLFMLKLKIWVLTNLNNKHNIFQKVSFKGEKMTAITKSLFSPAAADFCSG